MNKYFFALALLSLSGPLAADFATDIPFSWGEIAIRNNNSVSTVSVARNGAQQSTNQIFILKPGSPGVYTLSSFPPYTLIHLSVDLPAYSAMMYPNTAQFALTAVDLQSSINLGPAGSAQFKMGGTLSTSGDPSKNYYSGGLYVVYLNLNLVY